VNSCNESPQAPHLAAALQTSASDIFIYQQYLYNTQHHMVSMFVSLLQSTNKLLFALSQLLTELLINVCTVLWIRATVSM